MYNIHVVHNMYINVYIDAFALAYHNVSYIYIVYIYIFMYVHIHIYIHVRQNEECTKYGAT